MKILTNRTTTSLVYFSHLLKQHQSNLVCRSNVRSFSQSSSKINQAAQQEPIESTPNAVNTSQAAAMHERGLDWFNGKYGRIDYQAAIVWWEQAAAAKHPGASNRLGLMHLLGYGTEKSIEKAADYFRTAARLGDTEAANHLASLLQTNMIPSDTRTAKERMHEAADLFEFAARGSHSRAALNLAKIILVGESRPVSYKEALVWLEQAASAKLSEAAFLAALLHAHKPVFLTNSLSSSTSSSVRAVLHELHASRSAEIPLNLNRSFELMAASAELGSSDAHCELGDWYRAGTHPLKHPDFQTAAVHYRAAAELGSPKGQARIGMMLAQGFGVKQDRDDALLWLTTSANANNAEAHLGLVYLTLLQSNSESAPPQDGTKHLSEKQTEFVRDLITKVSESVHAGSSDKKVKSGVIALKRDPWLLLKALDFFKQSKGAPWVQGVDSLMQMVPGQ